MVKSTDDFKSTFHGVVAVKRTLTMSGSMIFAESWACPIGSLDSLVMLMG